MKYTSKAFKHGLRMIVVSATVSGEASEGMLEMAGESINTAAAGALDASAKRVLTTGLDAKAKAEKLKAFTREAFFTSAESVTAGFVGYKAPTKLADVKIEDAGAWVGGGESPAARLQAQAQSFFDLMVKSGMSAGKAEEQTKTVNPAFKPMAAIPTPTAEESGDAE